MRWLSETILYELESSGNAFCVALMPTVDGNHKIVMVISKTIIITMKTTIVDNEIETTIEQLPFTNIPSSAEIISIHCINRSKKFDDFVMGLTYVSISEDQKPETYLNIYTGSPGSSLEAITENCETFQIDYIPLQLNHTIYMKELDKKGMWLLSGCDKKIHCYKSDEPIYEEKIGEYFVEFEDTKDFVVVRFGTKSFSDYKKRISFYGCENGYIRLAIVDSEKNQVLNYYQEHYQSPIIVMQLFNINNRTVEIKNVFTDDLALDYDIINDNDQICLLVASATEFPVVYMNVLVNGISNLNILTNSNRNKINMSATIADINFDSKNEILVGTSGSYIFNYAYKDNKWEEQQVIEVRAPIYGMCYLDSTDQGMNDMIVLSEKGIHILKHDVYDVIKILKHRLKSNAARIHCKDC